jgi:tryptophanyl-tRNA synthetase
MKKPTKSVKPTVLSGIQPSGRLHIGNYLGALKNFVDLQNSGTYNCYFMIADLHSLTEEYEVAQKSEQIIDLAASYLAAGLDPKKSTLFMQSHVPGHTQLAWILSTLTPMGELSRMTQYKDKSGRMEANAGLFTYPVLQAVDILMYNPVFVPVGDDQDQHLELTRTLARKFNSRFGQTFFEPKALHTSIPRLMSLDNPAKKMSKSQPAGCLFIDDDPETIKKKIMGAVTDSGSEIKYDEAAKPGISNLLLIMSALSGSPIPELERVFAGKQYGAFKAEVAGVVAAYFTPIREKKSALLKKPASILKVFAAGAKKANAVAETKVADVYKKVGLIGA